MRQRRQLRLCASRGDGRRAAPAAAQRFELPCHTAALDVCIASPLSGAGAAAAPPAASAGAAERDAERYAISRYEGERVRALCRYSRAMRQTGDAQAQI